jgi:predicted nucleotidyltransferase
MVPVRTVPVALSGPLGDRLRQRRQRVHRVAAAHGVRGVRVFGSVARGDERPDSDVDLLVDLPPGCGLFGLGRLRADLERALDARVDVVPVEGLKPEVRAAVEVEAVEL